MAVVQLTDQVRATVETERDMVGERLELLRAQSVRLHELVAKVDEEVAANARLLLQMDEMLGRAPQLTLAELHGHLRGHRLREIAIEILQQRKGRGSVVHYREWYDLLIESGLRVAGKDPVATFLTQIARAPGVESVRPRSGLYRLRAA